MSDNYILYICPNYTSFTPKLEAVFFFPFNHFLFFLKKQQKTKTTKNNNRGPTLVITIASPLVRRTHTSYTKLQST